MSEKSERNAWQEGYDAADRGVCETRNPYPFGSEEYLAWNDGYDERGFEEESDD